MSTFLLTNLFIMEANKIVLIYFFIRRKFDIFIFIFRILVQCIDSIHFQTVFGIL